MKLDRNDRGHPKYLAINMRIFGATPPRTIMELIAAIALRPEAVMWCHPQTPDEFFLIKLADQFSREALLAYAHEAQAYDVQYAGEIRDLAARAGPLSPYCKVPD